MVNVSIVCGTTEPVKRSEIASSTLRLPQRAARQRVAENGVKLRLN
jgi:hypothetical protein